MQSQLYPTEVHDALSVFLTHDGRFVRLLREQAEAALGQDGIAALNDGIREYGAWVGGRALARARRGSSAPPGLWSMLTNWGAGELGTDGTSPWSSLTSDTRGVQLVLTDTPVMEHFDAHGVSTQAQWYYAVLFAGATRLLGLVDAHHEAKGHSLTFVWENPGATSADEARPEPPLPLQKLLLNTVQGRGALMAFTGRALLSRFGATGEYCLRTAISRFGSERGELMREDVTAKSLELNIENAIKNYDSGGHTSVWRWAAGGELSPSRQFQDCVYCPFIPVWQELGAMDIGRIYDFEFHIAQFRAYNPTIRLKWDAIQTEGADHCAFRFSLPAAAE
jgi:hypothetical protein